MGPNSLQSYPFSSVWKGVNQWGRYANKSANEGKPENTSPFSDSLRHSSVLTTLLRGILKKPEMCLIATLACLLLCFVALIIDTDQCLQTSSSLNDEIWAAKHVAGFLI